METPITDMSNHAPQSDREFLFNRLTEIESCIETLNREKNETLKEMIAPDEQMRVKHLRKAMTAEAIRNQILLFYCNLPAYKKADFANKEQLLKEIESRVRTLSKMFQRLRIEEKLEELKKERDKVKSDLANLNQQFGFHP
jgi:hypothetical protein